MKNRPKKVVIDIYWVWTGKTQHKHEMQYNPYWMVRGRYRSIAQNLKDLFLKDPLYREERLINGGKVKTRVSFIY